MGSIFDDDGAMQNATSALDALLLEAEREVKVEALRQFSLWCKDRVRAKQPTEQGLHRAVERAHATLEEGVEGDVGQDMQLPKAVMTQFSLMGCNRRVHEQTALLRLATQALSQSEPGSTVFIEAFLAQLRQARACAVASADAAGYKGLFDAIIAGHPECESLETQRKARMEEIHRQAIYLYTLLFPN